MNKNKIGAVIAGVSIAGAFGVKLYSQYKLLKSDEDECKEMSETTKEASDVSEQDLNDFEFDSILNEESSEEEVDNEIKMETLEPENDPIADINSLFEEENKDTVSEDNNVVSINDHSNVESPSTDSPTTDSPTTETIEDTKKEENYDSSMSKYKDMDINDPACWADFDKEIEDNK